MSAGTKSIFNYKTILGLFIILVGLIGLLNSFGFDTGIDFWDFWPLIFIIIGLGKLMQPAEYRNTYGGLIILAIGVIFQLAALDILDIGFRQLWPILLILVGAAIIRQAFCPGRKTGGIESNIINFSAVIGGGEYNYRSRELIGGSATTIMGGGTINLTNAEMQGDTLIIDVFAFMGGVDIVVPKHWSVVFNGLPIMGGMSDKTIQSREQKSGEDSGMATKKLIVKGIAIMGGVEVKN